MNRLRLTQDTRDPDRIPFPGRREDRRPDWRFDGDRVETESVIFNAERAMHRAQESLDELRTLANGFDDDDPPTAA